jgi:EAL domain-containing protein (putative c-di-GMP-specific phosphodiesterase class I)
MRRWAFEDPETLESTAGGNVSGVHSPKRSSPVAEDLELHDRMIGSIPAQDLGADFQPIVNLHTGETRGYEVLPRCRRDGLSDPEELFARATFERTVGELGRVIRSIAVRECGGSALHIPVHPGELRDRFLIQPDDPIFSHDAPVYLQLSQASLSGLAMLVVGELSSRSGVSLSIDDLGAGPATLKQLIDLEPGVVKLDRELIAGIDRSTRKQTVVRALVSMCERLGARVIAKGVDCEAELVTLMETGVVYGQGYVLGEPAPLPTISVWPPR